ncbi:fructosamine kinase family protein [Winogradskyella alexanderae]|uniref:Fructosamine kinase family protein n=1 Tax=Winogradskyella alexanderae TaxID=2877123 RepID=A0ABS7XS22_9FLAO|nr:fructosamine kinase family protein [Winogradskyella alexanderae]MCA0132204.1 fructosamine kinase family protein [Winogradskyella alexanderae]
MEDLKRHLESFLNMSIIDSRPLSGGDTSSVYKLDTENKTSFILKCGPVKISNEMFQAEVKGLHLIENTETIKTPKVYDSGVHNDISYILMEYVTSKSPTKADFSRLGLQLANLHKHSSASFGLDYNNFIGRLKQQNNLTNSWIDFYGSQRLGIQFKLASNNGLLKDSEIPSSELIKSYLETICQDIKPTLLHGDLWNGNFLIATDGTPYLIDPSVYFGHAEIDIAMSKLFGGFDISFYNAYHIQNPITAHYQKRLEIYQLYYLLVHLNMFGASYYSSVKRVLNKHF